MQIFRPVISAALRHYPFLRGYDRIALSKPLALFAHSEAYAIARLRDGQTMLVHGRDHVGRILLYMGDLEPRISQIARKILRPGDTVLDIGANLGWFSLVARSVVGPSGHIHAFEPQPSVNALFRATIVMNSANNITLHEVALSEDDGLAELHVLAGNYGAARLSDVSGDQWSTIEIQTVSAGQYLESLDLPPIRMIKIDVEGHEETVFRSAERFFRERGPDTIIFESFGDGPLLERPVARLLSDYGYKILSLDRTLLSPRLVPPGPMVASIDHIAIRNGAEL